MSKLNTLDPARMGEKLKKPRVVIENASEVALFQPIVIEAVWPQIDGGLFPVKCVVGETIKVEADIFKDGHEILRACIKYREKSKPEWDEAPMILINNDHWEGFFTPQKNTRYVYTVEAWVDPIATWTRFMEKKCPANPSVQSDLLEGIRELEKMADQARAADRNKIIQIKKLLELSAGASEEILRILSSADYKEMASRYARRDKISRYFQELNLTVDRKIAEFSAWYEMFPRSQTKNPNESGTFKEALKRLPEIKKMGFDVIYLPPIHPIGVTNRKGPNNSLIADKNSPGSPWAIGGAEGGHKAIHPDLGSFQDFKKFVEAAREYEMEVALDFALQCSPDHPYVKEHPEWFYRLPDGTIRFAENPPKKYEDIYPINFYCENQAELWDELRSIVLFWIERGVKIFRVDNPHTKPLRFWQWLIESVQEQYPETIFLAEAFTRPKVMKFLAKAGFAQSYTYFTWRNYKWDLRQYAEELTQSDMKHYFRGNFFANTPDILPEILQKGGRPAFKMRLVLAATLSSVYGIYSGFELCENEAVREGSEEYKNSEKYQLKPRSWKQEGNLTDYIARINQIRAQNSALHDYKNLQFFHTCNGNILCYGKKTPDCSNIIIVVVNLDPFHVHEDLVSLPIWDFGIEGWQTYQMRDLITGEKYYWKGEHNYVRLDPGYEPAHIFQLRK